jgi:hypothetical protein
MSSIFRQDLFTSWPGPVSARNRRGQGVRAVYRERWRWAAHGRLLRFFVPNTCRRSPESLSPGSWPPGCKPVRTYKILKKLAGSDSHGRHQRVWAQPGLDRHSERSIPGQGRPATCALPDGVLEQLPLPSRIGAVRTGGIDLNKPRIRAALAAALALAPPPHGFTVAGFAAKACQMTRHDGYTIRQAAYDLRKLRGKNLIAQPGRTRRYHVPPQAARTIAALLALRSHVIAPILAGVRSPAEAVSPHTGPPSTATTKPSAQKCRPSSTTSAPTAPSRGIDNILSMRGVQAPRSGAARPRRARCAPPRRVP